MPKTSETVWNPNTKKYETQTSGQDDDVLDRGKVDPALKGGGKSQEEVEASGGLGALAEKMRKAKTAPSPSPSPSPAPTPDPKKKLKPGNQLSALLSGSSRG